MNHLLKAVALAALLAGCNTTASSVVTAIQNAAVAACSFEPTAASVAAIITAAVGSTSVGTEALIATVAGNICAVVTAPKPLSENKTAAPWVYPGTNLPIQGGFVPKETRV
jgi:hypothetical protein